jgi:enoyl-CoA hydratase/carnithine racemase
MAIPCCKIVGEKCYGPSKTQLDEPYWKRVALPFWDVAIAASGDVCTAPVFRIAGYTKYAMSGGTLIVLAADEIVMDASAVLGPVDPQIGGMPAASIVKILGYKKPAQISDEMLILVDMAQKARVQLASFVVQVLLKHMTEKQAIQLATILSEGRWTHDFPLPCPYRHGNSSDSRSRLICRARCMN